MLKTFCICVFISINIVGFFIMGIDKKCAIKGEWRIPEKVLFLSALIGGGIGSTLGMYVFRHKTKHWYFVLGMPLIAAINIVSIIYILYSLL